MASRANLARQRLAAGEPARSPSPRSPRRIPHRPPDGPRGSHLAAPRPGAGGWLVPGLSSSSSSLSREGLRGAKNREKLCQGPPPLLRPPDISRARLPVQGRLLGAGEAASCVRSPAQGEPTGRRTPAWLSPSPAGEAGATRSRTRCPCSAPRLLLPPPLDAPGRSQRPRLRPGPSWPRRSRAGRVAAESADLGPGARNSPPTTLAQGFAPQASSGCILSGFALNSDFIWVICFLSSSQCTESFQTFGRGLRTKVCESTW